MPRNPRLNHSVKLAPPKSAGTDRAGNGRARSKDREEYAEDKGFFAGASGPKPVPACFAPGGEDNGGMNWIWILGIVVVVIAIVSVLGGGPRGGRPVGRTHLMGVARFVLIIAALIIGFLIFRARSHP